MPFIGKQGSTGNSKIKKYVFTADASQTAFSVSSDASDELQVFLNGVLLKLTDDYTYTTSTVTLGSGASVNDIVEVHVYQSFLIADAVKGTGDTMTGELEVPTVKLSSNVIKASDGGSTITLDDSDNVTIAGALTASGGIANAGTISAGTFNGTIGDSGTFPSGHIIKTYSQTFRGTDSNSTANYVIVGDGDTDELEITTDTPKSASSKFLIMVSIGAVSDGSSATTAFRLTRGGTFISESGSDDLAGQRLASSFRGNGGTSNNHPHAVSFNFLDSPNSSTALTYAVTYQNQVSITTTINYPHANSDTSHSYSTRTASTLIIFEIV